MAKYRVVVSLHGINDYVVDAMDEAEAKELAECLAGADSLDKFDFIMCGAEVLTKVDGNDDI